MHSIRPIRNRSSSSASPSPLARGNIITSRFSVPATAAETWNWVSNDDGQTVVDETVPWNRKTPVPASGSGLAFDRFHPGRVYLLDAFMVYQIDDIWADKPVFRALWKGVENTVVLTLCTPPESPDGTAPVLLSGVADIRGFRHADIRRPPSRFVEPTESVEYDWNTYVTGYDYCEGNPAVIMCASMTSECAPARCCSPLDGGQTWKLVTDPLKRNYGSAKIAVSARWSGTADSLKAVLAPGDGQSPRYTRDGGKTWAVCKAADGSDLKAFSPINHAYCFARYLASDRVDGETFSLYHHAGACSSRETAARRGWKREWEKSMWKFGIPCHRRASRPLPAARVRCGPPCPASASGEPVISATPGNRSLASFKSTILKTRQTPTTGVRAWLPLAPRHRQARQ